MQPKQNFWISKRDWSIRRQDTGEYVCDYPPHNFDNELMEKVCFAHDDQSVIDILEEYKKSDEYQLHLAVVEESISSRNNVKIRKYLEGQKKCQ